MSDLSLFGYQPPKGVQTGEELKRLQKTIGAAPSGVWDYSSQKAYDAYLKRFREPLSARYQIEGYSAPGMVRNQTDVKRMQEILGNVAVDGIWGPETDVAYWKRRAEEDAMTDTGSALSAASAGRAAEIAQKLRLAAPAKPGGSVSLPAVDNKTSLPYTGGVNTPAAERYQKTILNAPAKPAPSATARTTNAGKMDVGKYTINSVPEAAPAQAVFAEGLYNPNQGGRLVERPADEIDGAYKERTSKEGDTGKTAGYDPFTFYSEKDFAIRNACNALNLVTAQENREACCNLYSVTIDGKRHYFTGEVFVGKRHNVIDPYLTDASAEREVVFIDGLLNSDLIRYEGLIHSHPYSNRSNAFSGGLGDAAVATISGSIYLTTADGNIYQLSRPDNLFGDVLSGASTLLHSSLTGAQTDAADVKRYLDALHALKGWYDHPPTQVYEEGLYSAVTTNMRKPNIDYLQNIPETIIEMTPEFLQNAAIKRLYGPIGFYLYQKNKEEFFAFVRKFGEDAVKMLSQLNLYT